ncbi:MAG TPA: hypothetical protein V6C84_07165 [Coleofasciculaceae cyanobacterium]
MIELETGIAFADYRSVAFNDPASSGIQINDPAASGRGMQPVLLVSQWLTLQA